MIGEWKVVGIDGSLLGYSTITKDEEGFLLTEKWRSINGSTGTGISYFDPVANAWRQTYVGALGNITTTQGNVVDGVLELNGEMVSPNGTKSQSRSSTQPLDAGKFRYIVEDLRTDEGEWERSFTGIYEPVEAGQFVKGN
jgi:hypothetical protein